MVDPLPGARHGSPISPRGAGALRRRPRVPRAPPRRRRTPAPRRAATRWFIASRWSPRTCCSSIRRPASQMRGLAAETNRATRAHGGALRADAKLVEPPRRRVVAALLTGPHQVADERLHEPAATAPLAGVSAPRPRASASNRSVGPDRPRRVGVVASSECAAARRSRTWRDRRDGRLSAASIFRPRLPIACAGTSGRAPARRRGRAPRARARARSRSAAGALPRTTQRGAESADRDAG